MKRANAARMRAQFLFAAPVKNDYDAVIICATHPNFCAARLHAHASLIRRNSRNLGPMIERCPRLMQGLAGLLALSLAACASVGHAEGNGPPSLALDMAGITGSVHQGMTLTIRWRARHAPHGTHVSVWLLKTATGHLIGPLASGLSLQGQYAWRIPVFRPRPMPCARDRTGACIGDINPGTRYAIVLRLQSGGPAPGPVLASAQGSEFLMLLSH